MSLRGARKAIYRTPHQIIGRKSGDDQLIKNWEHDLQSAVAGLEFLIVQERKWSRCFASILDNLLGSMNTFEDIHAPVTMKAKDNEEDLVYDENEDFSNVTVNEIRQARRLFRIIYDQVTQRIETSKDTFVEQCEEMKDHIRLSLKLITKRNHKKIDYDMYHNSVDKLLKANSFNEKDKTKLETSKGQLDDSRTIMYDLDAKVKLIVPQVLETLSEFIHKLTLKFYYQNRDIFKFLTHNLSKYAELQGVIVHKQETEYGNIENSWHEKIQQAKHKLESLDLLNDYKKFQEKNFIDKTGQQVNHFTGQVVGSAIDFTSSLYTKTVNPHQRLNLRTFSIDNPVRPATRDGIFATAADPLLYVMDETAAMEEETDDEDSHSWLKPLSLEKRHEGSTTPESVPVTPRTPSTALTSPTVDQTTETARYLAVSVEAMKTRVRDAITKPALEVAPVTRLSSPDALENPLRELVGAQSSLAAALMR
ncbi:hypothetical protein OGAPHI_004738 [Ogataea philodendri]|uniref:BAR domain-containing protein n=1 Tax=Ogataea philodendri TaxID=1378263 RepID=A0A9P8T3B8_9ASCO|nr:uncharacterized protein OGAPHI_004738 [Ogataea philodendri]KAH3664024.1 hypothetical protein OGAPHI_004738 [Ogataea philodendri]